MIGGIKIGLLLAVMRYFPFPVFIKVGEIRIRLLQALPILVTWARIAVEAADCKRCPSDNIDILESYFYYQALPRNALPLHPFTWYSGSREDNVCPAPEEAVRRKGIQSSFPAPLHLPKVSFRNILWSAGIRTQAGPLKLIAQFSSTATIIFIIPLSPYPLISISSKGILLPSDSNGNILYLFSGNVILHRNIISVN